MSTFTTWKNRAFAKVLRYCPGLVRRWARRHTFASSADIPWTPLHKPLTTCCVALVTTGGVHLRTQPPFDMNNPLGDPSFREIPAAVSPAQLTITHDYYDHRDADRDPNIVFPWQRLRELVEQGAVGRASPVHLGFMGHIDGEQVSILQQQTAPAVAQLLVQHQVDVALLFPAWGLCNQSVGLIQRAIEATGISTVSISLVRDITVQVRPPRALCLRWPFGHPLGEPFAVAQHGRILRDMLHALETMQEPGTIIDLGYRWRREHYD